MSMEEARDYCARKDAALGKVNGSAAPRILAEAAQTPPILSEPRRPPEGSPMYVMNDYYAAKKRWIKQSECKA